MVAAPVAPGARRTGAERPVYPPRVSATPAPSTPTRPPAARDGCHAERPIPPSRARPLAPRAHPRPLPLRPWPRVKRTRARNAFTPRPSPALTGSGATGNGYAAAAVCGAGGCTGSGGAGYSANGTLDHSRVARRPPEKVPPANPMARGPPLQRDGYRPRLGPRSPTFYPPGVTVALGARALPAARHAAAAHSALRRPHLLNAHHPPPAPRGAGASEAPA
jgi:hypothetical protein